MTSCCWHVASVVSDSVWPHRRQPTRLPRPWDSPGKNTGVGCHFLLQWRWKWKMEGKLLSHVWLFATLWTAAYQAPLSMGFSRQQYWSELPLPSPYYSKVTLLILNFKKRNISGMKEFIVWRRKQRVTDRMMPTKKGLYLCKSCPLNCSCKIGAVAISDTLKILTLALMG